MSFNLDDDENLVFLKCIDPIQPQTNSNLNHQQIIISTSDSITWDLSSILTHQIVKVIATKNRLIQQSSYFYGLLSGSFSESQLECISIQWNLETFLTILKFMFGCPVDVTSENFLPLFEGALFFGVEMLLLKCKIWLTEVTSSIGLSKLQLDDLIHIWSFGLDHANDFIPELSTCYLAKNFMWAMACNSFNDVPYSLLLSCLKHPQLTVNSERHLSDALLVWLAANTERSSEYDSIDILKQIHISLLPLWFVAGKRRCRYFSKFAEDSIDAILSPVQLPSTSSMNVFGDGDLCHLRIRITEFTKKMDLSGCPQMKPAILLLSMLPCSYSTDPTLRKIIKQSLINHRRLDGDKLHITWGLWPIMAFEAVQEVNISNCPLLHLEAAIECFCKSFPSLRILKAAHFLNFRTAKLRQLTERCPLLCDIDLSVDISPLIPAQVSILSPSEAITPKISFNVDNCPSGAMSSSMSRPLLSNITKLTLEGRTDVSDYDLRNISEFCATLCYANLKGCISVTDAGIAVLILNCVKLHSIVVCDTSFGQNSILALLSCTNNFEHFSAPRSDKDSLLLAYKLQTLHMGGCKGVNGTSISQLLSQTHMLKSLCLKETQIVDNGLYSFYGSSLEMLDVSHTKVSAAALAHIVGKNPGLKHLKARGCRNFLQHESNTEVEEFPTLSSSCKELCFELRRSCKLEEIAVGWGFSCYSIEDLGSAITMLKAIIVGLGASLGQDRLKLLPTTCPLLESVILYFQVISDSIIVNMVESLRHLQVLALCFCLGDISSLSFNFSMPNLRKLRLERVTPWMTNDDLVILTRNCGNLIELSLLGCTLLNSGSQELISSGWPGLISIHLEECGEVTTNGISSLYNCHALEDLLLRHNGPGIPRSFILDVASKMPMLRKVSLDLCDAKDGEFDLPDFADRYFLSNVKIARCKQQRCTLDLQNLKARRKPVHKETLVLAWNSKDLIRTVVKERL